MKPAESRWSVRIGGGLSCSSVPELLRRTLMAVGVTESNPLTFDVWHRRVRLLMRISSELGWHREDGTLVPYYGRSMWMRVFCYIPRYITSPYLIGKITAFAVSNK